MPSHRSRTATVLAALLAVALAVASPTAGAEPTTTTGTVVGTPDVLALLDPLDRASVERVYREVLVPTFDVPSGWTGSTDSCSVGTESTASITATGRAVNAYRALAGLQPVVMDPNLNRSALRAALMMDAADENSHTPVRPWPCHTAVGERAAGSSNLSQRGIGPVAVASYMVDDGPGNADVGHRRWILRPRTTTMGTGSTGGANALYVVTDAAPTAARHRVTWPSAGYFPGPLVPARWSMSITGADFADAQVVMAVDRRLVPVTVVSRTAGYGEPTIVWEPSLALDELRGGADGEVRLDVRVSGIGGGRGRSTEAFTVRVFRPTGS
ncbi:MAG: CAP domain-containing protein [Actinomycetota bacterium]|nr:CAP domain-containing protein [Actinomycetota bacterium]